MAIVVECACGKRFGVKDEHAGKVIRCPGCKKPVSVPVPGLGLLIDTSEPTSVFVSSPRPEKSRSFWKDPVFIVGASVPAVILALFFGYLYQQRSERIFRDRIYTWKAKADQLAIGGNTRQAYDAYKIVVEAEGGHRGSDPQLEAAFRSARSTMNLLEPKVMADIKAVEDARKEEEKADRGRAEHLAKIKRLSEIKGDIEGTVFVNLKNGKPQVVPGTKIYLIKAELPKSDLKEIIETVRIIEGVARTPKTKLYFSDDEFEFFRESIDRAQALRDLPADALVDVRLLYAITRVNLFTGSSGEKTVDEWGQTVQKALVSATFTSIDGKYRFEDIPGGLYYLWTSYTFNRSIVEWVTPVELRKAGVKTFDLHNEMSTLILNLNQE